MLATAAALMILISVGISLPRALARRHALKTSSDELTELQASITSTQQTIRSTQTEILHVQEEIRTLQQPH